MNKLAEKKLVIYLADLDHFRPGNRYNVPIGIGSIASFCGSLHGEAVDISLFKDPNELIQAIRNRPPQILGCSFFMWNTNLTLKMIEAAKMIDNRMITVIGGASIARNLDNYKKILTANPSLDIIVIDQGEKSFAAILKRIFESNLNHELIFSDSLDGCASRLNKSGTVVRGKIIAEGIDINSFPSPYLKGYLDKFLQAGFVSSLETTRGCPHRCTFCCGGINTFLPLSVKNEETVYDELRYILKHATSKELDIADTNFGIMGERDLRISAFMLELYKKTGFPQILGGATTKQKTKTSIEMMTNLARIMGYLYFALQTLTDEVLENCQRINIPPEIIKELVAISKKNHWPIAVDTIFGLPGETLKSFMETFDKILSLGIAVPPIYQLKLLPGTIIAEKDRAKYGYKTKFRPLNGRFGEYDLFAGQKPCRVIEAEEIAWQNNSFNADDYLTIRSFGLISRLLVISEAFSDTISFLFSRGIKITEVFKIIRDNFYKYPRLQELFNEYKQYSDNELFDSAEDLINQITKNDSQWNDLLFNQGIYFKLDHGFSGYCLFEDTSLLENIREIIFEGVKNKLSGEDLENLKETLKHDKLYRIIQDKPVGKLTKTDVRKEIAADEIFNYEKWRAGNFSGSIKDFRYRAPVKKIYFMEKFDLFISKIAEYSNFSNYVFYEKIIIWGPQSLRRLCRQETNNRSI